MADRQVNLVQGDTGPDLEMQLVDRATHAPIDVSLASVNLYINHPDNTVETITATKPSGGADGVVKFSYLSSTWNLPGKHDGEVEVTFISGQIQTIYDKLLFRVREQI